jgi:arginyl-tRNA synthetase
VSAPALPLAALEERFHAAFARAFGAEFAAADPALRRSQHADYQANFALSLAPRLKRPPRAVAEAVVAAFDPAGVCDAVEIAGPGYVNLTLAPAFLSRALAAMGQDDRLGLAAAKSPETVVIDYSSPNIAKELHVGHLRSTILGDALARVHEALGHRVIRQNHLGDWGTPFGMLIEHMIDEGAEALGGDGSAFYKAARARFDADPQFAERARRRVVLLQGGDAPTLALWRSLVDWSLKYLAAIYANLGVTLQPADLAAESRYNPELPGIVRDLEERGLAVESEGALCIFPPGFRGKGGDPLPLILRKKDGGYGYATTDLAAIRHRTQTLGGTLLLYVVGAPQQLHLEMVFAAAKMAGWLPAAARAEHVAFGAVLGPDKKMLKSRSGESISLVELLDEARARAEAIIAERNPDFPAGERGAVGKMIGIGALKYADLAADRNKDYVFDWDRMLAFEGNTAPYLQYAHARIRSILRHDAARDVAFDASAIAVATKTERALALELLDFHGAVETVASSLAPHKLCTYLFALASAFTAFYEQCPVLRADTPEEMRARLALSELTARVLARGLELLGIDAPARM